MNPARLIGDFHGLRHGPPIGSGEQPRRGPINFTGYLKAPFGLKKAQGRACFRIEVFERRSNIVPPREKLCLSFQC